jgi:hypothetical protein
MTYMPMKPELRDDKRDKPDERRRRRIAGLLGGGAVSILALLVGVVAWSHRTAGRKPSRCWQPSTTRCRRCVR